MTEPTEYRRVGLFGGSFNPVHNGHVAAARAFMEQMWLDYLFIMPTGIAPHKEEDPNTSPMDRLKMCELAFEGMEGIIVSDLEIRKPGKSYTVDTLRALSAEDVRLFLLCGTDMVLTLDTWKEPDELFRLCYPVYVRRESDPLLDGRINEKLAQYFRKYGKMVRRITMDPVRVSSTQIREAVQQGQPIGNLVPPAVEHYIKEQGLYQNG
ncbi:MAG: nicotinate-nucleotide adenylyltransferase [Clostridia bacterium]|nr:nicotinate-nucleotide adenylyltransferase [Clostridia bacterium]